MIMAPVLCVGDAAGMLSSPSPRERRPTTRQSTSGRVRPAISSGCLRVGAKVALPCTALPYLSSRLAGRRAAICSPHATLCSPPRRPLQPARRHLQPACRPLQPARRPAAARPALPVRRHAGHRAALCSPRAALLQPAAPPFAARAPPLAARAPPFAPAHRPVAARPIVRSPAGQRPAARTALLCAALLLAPPGCCPPCSNAALLAGALLPAPPCCCPPCWSTPCCPRAALLLARRLVGSRTALPFTARFSGALVLACRPACVPPCWSHATLLCPLWLLSVYSPSIMRAIRSSSIHGSTAYRFEDLVTHLRTSDARYRAALPAEFLDRNPPPMYITLYFIVTRLPDSLRALRGHFLALDPTDLTVDLLEQHLLAAETSVVAVGAARGTPRTPFFEGCSTSPLAPSYASAAVVDILGTGDVGSASALSGKRRRSKGKGGKSGGGGSGGGGGGGSGGSGGGGGGGSGGSGGGSGSFGGGRSGSGGGGGDSGSSGGGQRQHQQRRSETPTPQQLREWFAQRGASGGSVRCPYVIRTVDIFALDYDAILAAMYALSVSAEGDCYLCVPPDLGIEAAALGASESALPGTVPAEALYIFTLDSGASRCFFRDSTTLTPLPASAPVRLADPSGGTVLARSSIVLPCSMVPSGSLPRLHLPSFSTNLVAPPCSCCLLSHHTLLWHHRLGHPSLPGLRGMHSRLLVSGLPRSLPPLPPSPASPCLPCVEGRQRAAPHSSSFPPTTAPLQTLHMDVWGPARVSAQGRERYFLLVVDKYTRYTTVFPLRSKGEVPDVLIPWIRAVCLQLRERFREDLPVLRLHSDRGGEFSSDLLREFCRGEGILQSFMLPAYPQQNGVAERRIGLVMEMIRTSMIHAAAPHFLWPFASVFRVWGSRAFVRDTSADKLSSRAIPCVFLGFPRDATGWQFYHPTSCRVLPSQDVTFDETVPFYRLFPYRSAPPPPLPLFLALVDPLLPQGPAPSGVSQVDPVPVAKPIEVAVDSGATRGAASGGGASGGAEPASTEPWGAEPEGAEPGGAESEGAESGGAEPEGAGPGGTELEGSEPGGAESEGAESGGAEPRGTASARGLVVASK
ncbi:unnamed protein product [Closterium sp. NIES-54]